MPGRVFFDFWQPPGWRSAGSVHVETHVNNSSLWHPPWATNTIPVLSSRLSSHSRGSAPQFPAGCRCGADAATLVRCARRRRVSAFYPEVPSPLLWTLTFTASLCRCVLFLFSSLVTRIVGTLGGVDSHPVGIYAETFKDEMTFTLLLSLVTGTTMVLHCNAGKSSLNSPTTTPYCFIMAWHTQAKFS